MSLLNKYLDGGDVNIIPIRKFGRNEDINTGEKESFWSGGGLYKGHPQGLVAERLSLVSSSASDVGKVIELSLGMDGEGNLKEKRSYTLNGLTPVLTDVDDLYSRMARAKITSSETNVGEITISHQITTANIFAVMPATRKTTHIAAMTVPKGYFFIAPSFYAFLGKVTGGSFDRALLFDLEQKHVTQATYTSTFPLQINTGSPLDDYDNPVPIMVDELTDIHMIAEEVTVSGTGVAGGFEGVLFPKSNYLQLYNSFKSKYL